MKNIKPLLIIIDILSLYFAVILAVIVRGVLHKREVQTMAEWTAAHTIIFFPSLFFVLLAIYIAGLYDAKTLYDRSKVIPLLIYTQISTAIFSIIYFYTLRTELTPKLTLFLYILFSIIILSLFRLAILKIISKSKKQKALFVSKDIDKINSLTNNLNIEYSQYDIDSFCLEYIDFDTLSYQLLNYEAMIYDEKLINRESLLNLEKIKSIKVNVYSYTQYYEFIYKKVDLNHFDFDNFIFNFLERKENTGHYLFRRFIDLSCAICILPFFILSLPFVYILNLFLNKGNIFSVQNRVGFLGKQIWLYKLRTMTGTDAGGIVLDDKNKNTLSKTGLTITKFGNLLRKARLDELPQVINLIKDEVSMIGPRADIIGVNTDMCREIENYKLRLIVPQGLSGWAQVHMQCPPRTASEHKERLAYEIYYIRNRSILLDISIILKTIKTMLAREGA